MKRNSKSQRHLGRLLALQLMYQFDMTRSSLDDMLKLLENWPFDDFTNQAKNFARELLVGIFPQIPRFDELLAEQSDNWKIDRMSIVDRNVLRLALFELHCQPDTPFKVVINEAIELAKTFGDEKSGQFVNGILDAIIQKYPSLSGVPS